MRHRLDLLGTPRILSPSGDPLEFPLGKPLAVLSYLAMEKREVRRDELARVFWPDSAPDRARHSVRQAIWLLRRKLGEDMVQGDDPVSVSADLLSTDLHLFESALRKGDLDHARQLWRGPLLSQLGLSDCRGWEHWREEQRGLTVQRFFHALVDRGRVLVGEGRSPDALPYLLEAIDLNPYSLEVRVLQVETLLELKEFSLVRQALEEARRDLGDTPGAEESLDRLEKILRERSTQPRGETPERLGESVEFVGRRRELGDLHGLWRRVVAGRVGVACVLGPTGIGKTRFGEEFLRWVGENGGVMARARGYRGEHRIPWGVVADLVRQLMALPGAMGVGTGSERVLRGMLPSMNAGGEETGGAGGVIRGGGGDLTPAALADAVLDLAEAVAFENPLVIFLDDWQWVDKESRALLGKVLRQLSGLPCLFLLAERTGERRLLQERAEDVAREARGRIVPLGPLDREELGELLGLLARFSDQAAADVVMDRIYGVTRGNPLFIGEILRKLAEDGVYRWEDGGWFLAVEDMPGELDLPGSVQVLIRERLERLSPSGVQLAGALAGERRSVPVGVLRRRSHLDEAVFTRAMGELLDREVLEWVGPKEVDFTHDQLRDAAGRFHRPDGWGDLPRRIRERPGATAVTLVVAVLLFALGAAQGPRIFGAVDPAESGPALLDRPFGNGRLILLGDSLLEAIPPRFEGEDWAVGPSLLSRPPGDPGRIDGPYRTPEGRVRWFGEHFGVEEPPYLLEFLEEGGDTVFFRSPGDDGFYTLGPDGKTAVLTSEDRSARHYRRDLYILPPGGSPRLVYSPAVVDAGADWSQDGRLLVTALHGAADTLLILDPLGRERGRWVLPGVRNITLPAWCKGSQTVVFGAYGAGPTSGVILDVTSGEWFWFGEDFLTIHSPVCLGRGSHVAYVGVSEVDQGVYVEDLDSRTVTPVFPIRESEQVTLRWLPDEVEAPLWKAEITGGARVLEWSQTDTLVVALRRSDGSLTEAPVQWWSLDVNVASVSAEGVVTGNGIGSTYLMAEAEGWVRDSVPVRVTEARVLPSEVLFRETFDTGDLGNWLVPDSTFPHPRVVEGEHGNVLSLPGDGRYRDFLVTREAYSFQYGVTLELEVRLPLSRMDRQRFGVCLQEVRRNPEEGGEEYVSVDQGLCIQYPTGMFAKYRDDAFRVYAAPRGVQYEVDASPHLPTDDWVHVAIQVRPDGIGSVFLNRAMVFEMPYVIRGHSTSLWRISLDGAAVDTELLFRDITLWRGARY